MWDYKTADYSSPSSVPSTIESAAIPSFVGKGAYTGAVLELGKILDSIYNDPSLLNLVNGLNPRDRKKLKDLKDFIEGSGNAFRWASKISEYKKEALFGLGNDKNPIKHLNSVLQKYFETANNIENLPRDVTDKLKSLADTVDREKNKIVPEPTLFDKGKDLAKGVAEKGKEIGQGVLDKGKDIADKGKDFAQGVADKYKNYQEQKAEEKRQQAIAEQEEIQKQDSTKNEIRSYLSTKTPFLEIYNSLPAEIIKRLEDIGLTDESVKGLASQQTKEEPVQDTKVTKAPVVPKTPKTPRITKKPALKSKLVSDRPSPAVAPKLQQAQPVVKTASDKLISDESENKVSTDGIEFDIGNELDITDFV